MNLKRRASILLLLCLFAAGCSTQATEPAATQEANQYVGSVNSDKYHLPDCQWAQKILPENEIWFGSKQEAKESGYVPCKVCNP